jgi:hypothetical protein
MGGGYNTGSTGQTELGRIMRGQSVQDKRTYGIMQEKDERWDNTGSRGQTG